MHAFIVTKMGCVWLGSCVLPHRHAQHSYAPKVSDSEKVGRCRTQRMSEGVGVSKQQFSRECCRLQGQGNYKAS